MAKKRKRTAKEDKKLAEAFAKVLQKQKVEEAMSAQEIVSRTRTRLTPRQQEAQLEKTAKIIQKEEREEKSAAGQKSLEKRQAILQKLKGFRKGKGGRIIRPKQPKFSTAATKLVSAFLPTGAVGGAVSSAVDSGRGRGRPTGTFKARWVPGIGAVKVPTHVYKKMLSAAKAKQRLAAAQQQAKQQEQFEAERIAMQQDPRFQPSAEDAFLEEPDMQHQQRVEQIRQQQVMQQAQQAQQPSTLGSRLRAIIRGNRPQQFGEQPFQEQFQQPQQLLQQPQVLPQREIFQRQVTVDPNLHRPVQPRVTAISERSNILNAPNIFGRRETNPIGFRR